MSQDKTELPYCPKHGKESCPPRSEDERDPMCLCEGTCTQFCHPHMGPHTPQNDGTQATDDVVARPLTMDEGILLLDAAKEYAHSIGWTQAGEHGPLGLGALTDVEKAFVAGAEWQRENG